MPTRDAASPDGDRTRGAEARQIALGILVLSAGAWVWLLLNPAHHGGIPLLGAQLTGSVPDAASSSVHSHHGPAGPGSDPGAVIGWYGGWVVMVVAMMLPPALPLVRVAARLVRSLPYARALLVLNTAAFAGVWALAGIVLLLTANLGAVLAPWHWVRETPTVPAGLAAVLAAGYQFTALKRACLRACRSPLGLAMTTWTGTRSPASEVTLLGVRYGIVCVGCCWALMLLTVAASVAALPVMVIAAVLMAAERLLPRVRTLVPVVAGAALGYGLLLLAVPLLGPAAA